MRGENQIQACILERDGGTQIKALSLDDLGPALSVVSQPRPSDVLVAVVCASILQISHWCLVFNANALDFRNNT